MAILEMHDITCAYGENAVVSELSLEARPGEVLGLIGPNGVGKSTLLRAMARLLRPTHGKVVLSDGDLWSTPPREVARKLAFAPQANGEHWPATIEQIIALGRAPHRGWFLPMTAKDQEATERALTLVGLTHLRGRVATELSGGEQQRVVLGRVLAQEPTVLLLDEPTSHLDLKYQTDILGLARRLAHQENLTVVVSLHDLNLAAIYADRLALLSKGQLVAVGTPREVLTPESLTEVYGVPIIVMQHPLWGTPLVMPDVDITEAGANGG
ncbi:MAG: heme ABC transporter ATP-binding protein [Anaerolineales bacterium]|nr:heme ABC transporter ATP-binding protein [Anaerolineales bacterium]